MLGHCNVTCIIYIQWPATMWDFFRMHFGVARPNLEHCHLFIYSIIDITVSALTIEKQLVVFSPTPSQTSMLIINN